MIVETISADGEYFTAGQAASMLGISVVGMRKKFTPEKKERTSRGWRFFYSRAQLDRLKAQADKRCACCGAAFTSMNSRKKTCSSECSRKLYSRSAAAKIKKKIIDYRSPEEDEFGVMVKRKVGSRTCPACGKKLFIGQYRCECQAPLPDDPGRIDDNYVYGG